MDIQAPSLDGPITRSKAKALQGKLASFITHFNLVSETLGMVDEIGKERSLLQLEMETTGPNSATNSAEPSNELCRMSGAPAPPLVAPAPLTMSSSANLTET